MKKHKLLPLKYVNTNCPLPGDVDDFLRAVKKFRTKKGSKPYQKNRDRADRLVRRLLMKHNVIGTISARFWYLEAICMLIKKSNAQVAKEYKLARKLARRAEKKK